VDYLTIPAARFQSVSTVFFKDKDIFTGAGNFGGDRQSYYTGADDDDINFISHEKPQQNVGGMSEKYP
jgi:hypothetical protein